MTKPEANAIIDIMHEAMPEWRANNPAYIRWESTAMEFANLIDECTAGKEYHMCYQENMAGMKGK